MQYSRLALVLAIAVPFVAAQSYLDGLSPCVQTIAVNNQNSTKCELSDVKCVCNDSAFLQSLQQQITKACNPADQQDALGFVEQLCGDVGITATISTTTTPASSPTPLASPVNLNGLTPCAQTVAQTDEGLTRCQLSDVQCICTDTTYLQTLQQQIAKSCPPADQQAAFTFAQQLCAAVSDTLPPPASTSIAVTTSYGQSAPVVGASASPTAVSNATTTSANPSLYTGAASNMGAQGIAAAAVGAAAVIFAGL